MIFCCAIVNRELVAYLSARKVLGDQHKDPSFGISEGRESTGYPKQRSTVPRPAAVGERMCTFPATTVWMATTISSIEVSFTR
jgi:hypothetical protein